MQGHQLQEDHIQLLSEIVGYLDDQGLFVERAFASWDDGPVAEIKVHSDSLEGYRTHPKEIAGMEHVYNAGIVDELITDGSCSGEVTYRVVFE